MGRSKSTLDTVSEIGDYMAARIREVQDKYGVTNTVMASIAGYERTAFHRNVKACRPLNPEALYRLSVYYRVPIDHWFPPRRGAEERVLPKVIVREGAIPTMLPLTRQMINKLNKLPKDAKRHILVLALQSPELVPDAIAVAKILAQMDAERKKRLIGAMAKIAKETCQPAP